MRGSDGLGDDLGHGFIEGSLDTLKCLGCIDTRRGIVPSVDRLPQLRCGSAHGLASRPIVPRTSLTALIMRIVSTAATTTSTTNTTSSATAMSHSISA